MLDGGLKNYIWYQESSIGNHGVRSVLSIFDCWRKMTKKQGKRYKEAAKLVDKNKAYSLQEAVEILKKAPHAQFDETVEISLKLEIDTTQSEQQVRGAVVLPHGTGKKVRIVVFCKGEDVTFAKEAGADFVGGADLIEKVAGGWLDFDIAIATPELMRDVAKLGKILGPRGLMPSPKAGTVDSDVKRTIKDVKSGKVSFKMDKSANLHIVIGKISFDEGALVENGMAVFEAVKRSKSSAVKGRFIKSAAVSTTMGPGVRIDASKLQ